MRVRIDRARCVGHAMCALAAPELFKLDGVTGYAYLDDEEVPVGLEAQALIGSANCPERAIEIIE